MKKALCLFLAIVFVCCVITHGKNERFSLEVFLNNITNFQDMPTMQDIANCWTEDFYWEEGVLSLPYWVDVYSAPTLGSDGLLHDGYYYGYLPLAYDIDGNILEDFSYVTMDLYKPNGELMLITVNGVSKLAIDVPVVLNPKTAYEPYVGENPVLQFFGTVKAFFLRLWNTCEIIVRMVVVLFGNLKYLLPWNSTVPKGAI